MKRFIWMIGFALSLFLVSCSHETATNPIPSASPTQAVQMTAEASPPGQETQTNAPKQTAANRESAVNSPAPTHHQTTAPPAVTDVPPTTPPVTPKALQMSIHTDENSPILSLTEFPFTEGESVLELLIEVGKEKKIPVVFNGSKKNGYVAGIGGLFEFDKGPESGWIYKVNGVRPSISSGSYYPKENDIIVWEYILSSSQ